MDLYNYAIPEDFDLSWTNKINDNLNLPPVLLLNTSNYNDNIKLNDANIYKDNLSNDFMELYTINIDKNFLMYRGLYKTSCGDIYPSGSKEDRFKEDPIWFGSFEVAIIYGLKKIEDSLIKRIFPSYSKKTKDYDLDKIVDLYQAVLYSNLSSNIACSIKKKSKLIDINNIDNLKTLMELFRKNYSSISEEHLSVSNNTKKYISNILNVVKKHNNVFNPMAGNVSDDEYIKLILEWNFRKCFGFGPYYSFDAYKYKYTYENPSGNPTTAILKKYYLNNGENIKDELYDSSINYDGNEVNSIDVQNIKNKKNIAMKKINDVLNDVKEHIVNYNKEVDNYIIDRTENLKKFKTYELNKAKNIINKIKEMNPENNINHSIGYIHILKNGTEDISGYIGFEKLENNKYLVHHLPMYTVQKYNNPSTENATATVTKEELVNCAFCNVARTKDWVSDLKNKELSRIYGLANNSTYYEYDVIKNKPEPIGITFQQAFEKDYVTKYEEKCLAIPFNHMGTRNHHPDCGIGSKNYPPNGNYTPKEKNYSCGAAVYYNSNDSEIITNLFGTYKSAKIYAYQKTGKKHRIADINYENHTENQNNLTSNGRFYKFLNPTQDSMKKTDPKMYLVFHALGNSIPHLHMHIFLDSNGENLYYLAEADKITTNNANTFIGGSKEKKNLKLLYKNTKEKYLKLKRHLQKGGDAQYINEIFGSRTYGYTEEDYKFLMNRRSHTDIGPQYQPGERMANENSDLKYIPWVRPYSYVDIYGKLSSHKEYEAVSFEYLFKKVLGYSENDKRMQHHYIFPEPDYETFKPQQNLSLFPMFPQKDLYGEYFKQNMEENFKIIYQDNINPLFKNNTENVYRDFKTDFNGIQKGFYENSQMLYVDNKTDILSTKYGNNADGTHILRYSDVNEDKLMMLFLQIACEKYPEIAGYYSHSAPISSSSPKLSHPEIGIFNSKKYPVYFIKNAPHSYCNIDGDPKEILHEVMKEITLALHLYVRYMSNSQLDLLHKDTEDNEEKTLIKNNPIDLFMTSGTDVASFTLMSNRLIGGKLDILPERTNRRNKLDNNLDAYMGLNDRLRRQKVDQSLYSAESMNRKNNINTINIQQEKLQLINSNKPKSTYKPTNNDLVNLVNQNKFKEIINEYNTYTKMYQIDPNDEKMHNYIKNIILSIYYEFIPTAGQIAALK